MIKLIKLSLLFLLLLLVFAFTFLQTPYAHRFIRDWIEEKSNGALQIGKLSGTLPFRITLESVCYSDCATFDRIDLSLSPNSITKLSIDQIHIRRGTIKTDHASTSSLLFLPFPVVIHSLKIDALTINNGEEFSLSGSIDLTKNVSCSLTALRNNLLLHLDLNKHKEDSNLNFTAHLCHPCWSIWAAGKGNLATMKFVGSLSGAGNSYSYPWQFQSNRIVYENNKVNFSSIAMHLGQINLNANGTYDFVSHDLKLQGVHLNNPYSVAMNLDWKNDRMEAETIACNYTTLHLGGQFFYAPKEHTFEGDLALTAESFLPFTKKLPLEGKGRGDVHFSNEGFTGKFQAHEIHWKQISLDTVTFETSLKDKTLNYQVQVTNFNLNGDAYEVFPTASLQLIGTACEQKIQFDGSLGLGSAPLLFGGEIPLSSKDAPFSLYAKGKGSTDPLLAFLENASLIAKGKIDLDLSLSGSWNKPVIAGFLLFEAGEIQSLTTGALYRNIQMKLEGEGNKLVISSLFAQDVDKGELSGKGSIACDLENGFPLVVQVEARQFTFFAVDPFMANMNARVTLRGSLHALHLAGEAEIMEGHLSIPNKMPTQVPVVEVIYINPLPQNEKIVKKKASIIPLTLDLRIEAPKNFHIEGRGLISEWRGSLQITNKENLCYDGKLKLVQGRFHIINRTFDLTEGQIRIDGIEPKDIYVEMKGNLELRSITASLNMTGTLDATRLNFCSIPPMSTNQILSWILFNQDVNELTPFQACRLANVLVSLSGKYAGPKLFDTIKEGLGIDVFDITRCDFDAADFSFQVGKYLSQGTFVGINKSLSGEYDSILIQTRLFRDFFLEADYGGSLNGVTPNGGKMIFKWYKSY